MKVKITVYSTSTCPYCRRLKEYLAEKGVAYEEIVLDRQPEKMGEMQSLSGGFSGVPFTVVTKASGEKATIKGFDKEKLETILKPSN